MDMYKIVRDAEYAVYHHVCNGCEWAKRCHENCTVCEVYAETLEATGKALIETSKLWIIDESAG